jgi:hypothetical protein
MKRFTKQGSAQEPPMPKTLVSAEQLLDIINTRLQQREACVGCVVAGSIERLEAPLSDGGNWTRSIAIRGKPRDPQACGDAAHEVIQEIATEFNLR